MDATLAQHTSADDERNELRVAHDEIRTVLTVICSNVNLLRARFGEMSLGADAQALVDPRLDALDVAAERLLDVARRLRRRYDGLRASDANPTESAIPYEDTSDFTT